MVWVSLFYYSQCFGRHLNIFGVLVEHISHNSDLFTWFSVQTWWWAGAVRCLMHLCKHSGRLRIGLRVGGRDWLESESQTEAKPCSLTVPPQQHIECLFPTTNSYCSPLLSQSGVKPSATEALHLQCAQHTHTEVVYLFTLVYLQCIVFFTQCSIHVCYTMKKLWHTDEHLP